MVDSDRPSDEHRNTQGSDTNEDAAAAFDETTMSGSPERPHRHNPVLRNRDVPVAAGAASAAHRLPSFDGYEVHGEIHRGGQGVVYLATQQYSTRRVAIKVLLEGPYASASAQTRFEREIQLVSQLDHPHIVGVSHAGLTRDGYQFLVMDHVEGDPLDLYVLKHDLDLDAILILFRKICHAVEFAHLAGVIHRDLKPSNILVDKAGEPRVLDFGLAKQISDDPDAATITMTGHPVGSLPYMSPEQAENRPQDVDARTDVYALGVILYQLITGRFPYPVTGSWADILNHISKTPPTPFSSEALIKKRNESNAVARRIPSASRRGEQLQSVVFEALAKSPHQRFQSVAAFSEALETYSERKIGVNKPTVNKRSRSFQGALKILEFYRDLPPELRMVFVVVGMGAPSSMIYLLIRSLEDFVSGLRDIAGSTLGAVGLITAGNLGIVLVAFVVQRLFRFFYPKNLASGSSKVRRPGVMRRYGDRLRSASYETIVLVNIIGFVIIVAILVKIIKLPILGAVGVVVALLLIDFARRKLFDTAKNGGIDKSA